MSVTAGHKSMKKPLPSHDLLLRIMKITFTQCLLAIVHLNASYATDSHAQEVLDRRLSLRMDDKPLKTILSKIESSASVKFI